MKWFRSPAAAIFTAACMVVGARGELVRWVRNIEAGKPLESVFFKLVTVGPSTIPARRPPSETRTELTKLIGASPAAADLYSLRALEAEQQLDAAAAESDWMKFAQLTADKFAGQTTLAAFYNRRNEPAKELASLHAAAILPASTSERGEPAIEQGSWKTFERIIGLIDDHLLGFDTARAEFLAWIARYPAEPAAYSRFLDYAVAHKQFPDAEEVARQYTAAFPNDAVWTVRAQAKIEAARGSTQAALALYDRSFQPLWPPELVKSYFELLTRTGSLRRFFEDARSNNGDIKGTARIFYYWQQQGNLGNAQHALMEFETRRKAGTAEDLWTLAQLYEIGNNPDRAARSYYALYSRPGVAAADAERALAGLANLLFTYADQGIRFGSSDLSYYRDIAQADPYPGYLNGILSLILNTTEPSHKYSEENQNSQPYFHRARASELVTLFDSRFPNSPQRAPLNAKRINAYAIHGDNEAVIQAGARFRARFPNAAERTAVATLMADAYARMRQPQAEFALYDELLLELAPGSFPSRDREGVALLKTRAADYSRILDRYIARLVGMQQMSGALALYRREIDRNPYDPALYERFATFLEQNRLGAEVEATYKRAMAQFPDGGWSHKLARWYLREKQTAQLAALTRDVTSKFSGTELEAYFEAAVPRVSLSAALYLQLNLYAHQRFPHDLAFTRNLLTAYQTRGTADAAAYEALLRANWFYAADLRMQFFEYLSSTKKLDGELAALGSITTTQQVNANPAAADMLSEGESWRAHFESAAPVYRLIAVSYPASSPTVQRAASLYRSLATIDPKQADVAAAIEQNLVSYAPADTAALTYKGEIYADRNRFDRARPLWNRISSIRPGRPDGYLESATVFWDYFLFDDALRVIGEARNKLNDPTLFAYQAGAIFENKREYDHALTEYASAALNQSSDVAQRRIVRLARRPTLRDSVERLTADAANRPDASPRALQLRAAVLENQGRRGELEQFLSASTARTSSFETIEWLGNQGRISGFASVQEAALERRIAITSDPVDQMRFQLALAHFYEDQNRGADARRILVALYAAHPKTLGVVRAAADYYWRSGQPKLAVETLTGAADRAQPVYQRAFRLEAARKATEAGDTTTAREVLALLLKEDPYRPEYLTAIADTYARAADDSGLRAFYQATIEALRTSNLSAADKIERTAAMRRGLIPVLTRVQDYAGSIDQYIEILNRYPEDEQLAREAASYAGAHQLGDKLIAFYARTEADSPRDHRWPVVLARVDTELERFPEAVEQYSRATAIRPDRTDLWIAQAQLDERLQRFADAERNYTRLFELTYHNALWMERVALVRARQGQRDGAVAALRAAYIENRPERAENYFEVASKLDEWGYVPQALQFAEKGAEVAGPGLTKDGTLAALYGRIFARARQAEAAYRRLPESAMRVLGETVRTYYTPEEKTAFAAFLVRQPLSQSVFDAADSAGLEDLAVQLLTTWLRANPADGAHEYLLIERQRRRLRFDELGAQLEAAWKRTPAQQENRDTLLVRAAEAYQQAGDAPAELRVIRLKQAQSGLEGSLAQRLCRLLVQQPQALASVAASDPAEDIRDMAANCAIQNEGSAAALSAVAARGTGLPRVWTSAYTALTGLYFSVNYSSVNNEQVNDAFVAALGSPVIGDRIGKPVDRERQLAGQPWFYYGSRYGEYLALARQPDAADYLPAMLEAMPGNAIAYSEIADYYSGSGKWQQALIEYGHSLELDPRSGAVRDRTAEALWSSGRHDDAVDEWRRALQAFNARQDRGSVPPAFIEEIKSSLTNIGRRDVLAPLRVDADKLLRTYLHRNGTYMFEPLLEGILAASGDPAKGVAWLVELSQAAADPMSVLASAVRNNQVPESQRDLLFGKLIDFEQGRLSASFGQPREAAESSLRSWQMEWLRSLVARKQANRAQALLNSIPVRSRKSFERVLVPLELQIAAQSNSLPALLARYATDPPLEPLRNGANELRRLGYDGAARRVLDFVFTRELQAHHFDAANFLGLAEIRLQEKQTPAALELLRRMNMLSGEPFETLTSAAALLERFGQNTEAATFYEQRLKAVPWDVKAREQLAALRNNAAELTAAASDQHAPYEIRAEAALTLRRNGGATLSTGTAELDLLASSTPLTEASVSKPYWYWARLEAASAIVDPAAKIRILSAAIATSPVRFDPFLDLFRIALQQKRYQLAISSMPARPDRAFVASGLGEAYMRLSDPERSVFYYRLALELDPSRPQPNLQAMIQAIEVRKANDERRPVVSRNLEQPHLVRPRRTAGRGGAQ